MSFDFCHTDIAFIAFFRLTLVNFVISCKSIHIFTYSSIKQKCHFVMSCNISQFYADIAIIYSYPKYDIRYIHNL